MLITIHKLIFILLIEHIGYTINWKNPNYLLKRSKSQIHAYQLTKNFLILIKFCKLEF